MAKVNEVLVFAPFAPLDSAGDRLPVAGVDRARGKPLASGVARFEALAMLADAGYSVDVRVAMRGPNDKLARCTSWAARLAGELAYVAKASKASASLYGVDVARAADGSLLAVRVRAPVDVRNGVLAKVGASVGAPLAMLANVAGGDAPAKLATTAKAAAKAPRAKAPRAKARKSAAAPVAAPAAAPAD